MNLLVVLLAVFLIVGLLPAWPYSASWGYLPSGTLLLIAAIVAIVLATGRRGRTV